MLESVKDYCRDGSAYQGSADKRRNIEEPSEALSAADESHDRVGDDGADDARSDNLAQDGRPDLSF